MGVPAVKPDSQLSLHAQQHNKTKKMSNDLVFPLLLQLLVKALVLCVFNGDWLHGVLVGIVNANNLAPGPRSKTPFIDQQLSLRRSTCKEKAGN